MCRRTLIALISLALAAAVSAVVVPAARANLTPVERQVLTLVNQQRAARGLPALRPQDDLMQAARGYSRAMARSGFFSHVSPDGSTPSDRCIAAGYSQSGCSRWMIGETLAWGSGAFAVPECIVNGWMNSAPHRRILLTAGFQDIGVGTAKGAITTRSQTLDDVTYFTLDLGARAR